MASEERTTAREREGLDMADTRETLKNLGWLILGAAVAVGFLVAMNHAMTGN